MRTEYRAVPTLSKFHRSDTRRRGVRGPVGSGKSTAMCMEIMRRAREQKPSPKVSLPNRPLTKGTASSRWTIVRNTYGELKDTTLKTWLDWWPESHFGAFRYSGNMDMTHPIVMRHPEDHWIELEVLFRALDRPEHIKKVLSLEITGAWVNEAREVPLGIIQALDDRIDRYPAQAVGGPTWAGLILDTNPPDDDHWWYRLAEEDKPEGWDFFSQPGGLIERGGEFVTNPEAENLDNLAPNYYEIRAQGKRKDHVRVYYCNRYGFVQEGKPVYPEYADDIHCPGTIEPIKSVPLYVGLDFGLTPAALLCQQTITGRWIWVDELVTEDMGATRFAEQLGPKLRGEYREFDIRIFGDPAGAERSQVDEQTVFAVLHKHKIMAELAPTQDPIIRRDAVANPMTRMIEGKPGFLISDKCRVARKALAGGYALRRLQVPGEERYRDAPDKNRYSHVVEAGQYAMCGAGEGYTVVGLPKEQEEEFDYEFEHGRDEVTGY